MPAGQGPAYQHSIEPCRAACQDSHGTPRRPLLHGMFVHTLRRVTRLVVGCLWPGYQAPAKEAAERASGSLTLLPAGDVTVSSESMPTPL